MVTARHDRPRIVVVTPVKDEAWILDTFLSATTSWADEVIIADQQSTDGSVDIARQYDRVRVVQNDSQQYDEGYRQRLLLEEARKVPSPRIIFALDADEVLSANALNGDFFDQVAALPPGAGIRLKWVQLLPGLTHAWLPPEVTYFGFVDDGSEHTGHKLHSTRLPVVDGAPQLTTEEVVMLHLNYLAVERSRSKHSWYQCWERLHFPKKRPVQIYRQYHPLEGIHSHEVQGVNRDWLAAYAQDDIKIPSHFVTPPTRWDREVLEWIRSYGRDRFAKLDIWDVDWSRKARELGCDIPPAALADPRSATDRAVMNWLARTQPRAGERRVRWAQRSLRLFGW
jgi:glycosyltransferase involved in cell wall biosynthesis